MHKIKRKVVGYIRQISGSYPVVSIVSPRQLVSFNSDFSIHKIVGMK